jgi:hypothetical protein
MRGQELGHGWVEGTFDGMKEEGTKNLLGD